VFGHEFKISAALTAVLLLAGGQAVQAQESFFNEKEFNTEMKLLDAQPVGPANEPWRQALAPTYTDMSQYKKPGPYTICFSNAGVFNPWRAVGFKNMQGEVALHKDIKSFVVADAEGKDDKQIADIADLVNRGDCSILIVSPNTTAALTPAVEQACKKLPVIVFDRGVDTTCPVTFITPLGGYAFGAAGARFLAEKLPKGAKVLALRVMPGVDVLEYRWIAAKKILEDAGLKVIGVEFTHDDRATAKSIVTDYLERFGQIDGLWMDAGATAVAELEAFSDGGYKFPVVTGEDQQDFLVQWKKDNLTAIAPTNPTFQWRTPIIASLMVLNGEKIPTPVWRLPQPTITQANLDQYLQSNMPPQHYALCGCENLPGYPEEWGGTKAK
jgi:ribose transport system substrate-binding protein